LIKISIYISFHFITGPVALSNKFFLSNNLI